MKKAIVTGACGFIGSHLVSVLLEHGMEVLAVDLPENEFRLPTHSMLQFLGLDLAQASELPEHIDSDWDIFYHLAWRGSAGRERSNYRIQLDNVSCALSCYEAAQTVGCKHFIATGTVGEYMTQLTLENDIVSENYIYALSKRYLRTVLQSLSKTAGIAVTWCTLCGIYGEADLTGNLVNYTINALQSGEIPTYTKAEQLFDFLHVSDVARALYSVGKINNPVQSYYIGSGNPKPLREYLVQIRDIIAPGAELGIGKRAEDGTVYKHEWLDSEKFMVDTGFSPRLSFEDGIRLFLRP